MLQSPRVIGLRSGCVIVLAIWRHINGGQKIPLNSKFTIRSHSEQVKNSSGKSKTGREPLGWTSQRSLGDQFTEAAPSYLVLSRSFLELQASNLQYLKCRKNICWLLYTGSESGSCFRSCWGPGKFLSFNSKLMFLLNRCF